jgi:uncharacterized protein YyaL (SSP411 family)
MLAVGSDHALQTEAEWEHAMSELDKELPANRLAEEKSPYLLQHAHNPVDWFPWGEEAFARARREDKPIFLSIGYSTCHWCHVMERESFENQATAELMNELFVNIKVDREERPDVDRVYMTAVQALTGHGGWPLSVWLTPELKPFFGGTYFPPQSHYGRPGFPEILQSIGQTWQEKRAQVDGSAEKIYQTLARQESSIGSAEESSFASLRDTFEQVLDKGYFQLAQSYDAQHGGFGRAPKFPRPATFGFLFRYWARTEEGPALDMTLNTLRKMWAGGMVDHLGGGFHRYSVDDYWRIPHFEKMLYDQAQLACSYLEAYQITAQTFFEEVVRETLEYVMRDLTDPAGGFYSAEDADSAPDPERPDEKEEGAFYMWTAAEVERVLGEEDATPFMEIFGITEAGNSITDPTGELGARNVLYQALSVGQAARKLERSPQEIEELVERGKRALLEARGRRLRPHLDDKIITAWNGLMISAFSRAASGLGESRYLEAANRAAGFVARELCDQESATLLRRFRDGEARHPAHLEDYAFLVQGLLDLYEAGFDARWLDLAVRLTETQNGLFWDGATASFYATSGDDPSIILRTREVHDGAEPSGSSVAAGNLLRLAWILDRPEWRRMAEQATGSVSSLLETSPISMPQMLAAVDFALQPPQQIVIAGETDAEDTRQMLEVVTRRFLPHKILLRVGGQEGAVPGKATEFYRSLERLEGKATAYVCENYACQLPTNDPSTLESILDEGSE